MENPEILIDYCCRTCKRKLARAPKGAVMEIKCGRCKALNLFFGNGYASGKKGGSPMK